MPYADPAEARAYRLRRYREDPELFRQRSRERYARNPEPARERAKGQRKAEHREQQRRAAEVERLLRESRPVPVPYAPGDDLSWQDGAACAGLDTDLFFEPHVGVEVQAACLRCPVRAECLGMALAFPSTNLWGFWAGTSHQERQRLRRDRGRAAATGLPREAPEPPEPSSQVSEGETPVIAGQQG